MSTSTLRVPLRTRLHADPNGVFLHDLILESCRKYSEKTALVDTSLDPPRRISFAEYGDLVERAARGLVAAGIRPGEFVAIFLPNCWEFGVAFHATQLAGATPAPVNPSYKERELRYQLENSGAAFLISDGPLIANMNLAGLPGLRKLYTIRQHGASAEAFDTLLQSATAKLPEPAAGPENILAALPYSSGTTGLPKGVMLTHSNLVTNIFQLAVPGEELGSRPDDILMAFLPLYHIYGLNVVLSPALAMGATQVLMPRFDLAKALQLIMTEGISCMPLVPPVMNAYCMAAEQGMFPKNHRLRSTTSGAAPLPADLPRRYTELTGCRVGQGYGMTEASPVTHFGFLEPQLYRPDSIGHPVARTECRIVDDEGNDVPDGSPGELVMRGPQFMLGYWQAPEATADVLRDGWYWSGDVAVRDAQGFYKILDRRKEMIKFKGFPVAPAEVEALLLEHPAVRDCGVVGKPDACAGEVPCAFVVLRDAGTASDALAAELCTFVGERLTSYKQPQEVRFVSAIPRNPSGKILRREMKESL